MNATDPAPALMPNDRWLPALAALCAGLVSGRLAKAAHLFWPLRPPSVWSMTIRRATGGSAGG